MTKRGEKWSAIYSATMPILWVEIAILAYLQKK